MELSTIGWRGDGPIRASDLAAIEADRRLRLHLHGQTAHTAGVLQGLSLQLAGERCLVDPGVALDVAGRPLGLPEPAIIDGADLNADQAVDLRLHWTTVDARPEVHGRARLDARQPTRRRETAEVRRHPAGASPARSGPMTEAADPPPVGLGRIHRGDALALDLTPRQLAGATGERLEAVAGGMALAWIAAPAHSPGITIETGGRPGLRVGARGEMRLDGRLAVGGELATPGIRFRPASAPAAAARPWSLARVAVPATEQTPAREVLRLEIADPGAAGDPRSRRFEVWQPGADETPAGALLAVAADGTVTVARLEVSGERIVQPAAPDPDDPAYRAAAVKAMVQGLTAALALGAVVGTVVDPEDAPIPGAAVRLVNLSLDTATDQQGRFVFLTSGAPGQLALLTVSADGFVMRTVPALLGVPVRVTLSPEKVIE